MTTNSVKHAMLQLAKKIANKEYKDRTEKARNGGTCNYEDYIIPASIIKNDEINSILKQHPEFDAGTFRAMIKEIQIRNKQEKNK